MTPEIGTKCLVKIKGDIRIAYFRGIGLAWGGYDWIGDSGHSTDSWRHIDVEWYISIEKIAVKIKDQKVIDLFINQI